jgi:1-acyl-sn-glycerol-3-phosphate acyltransferase
MPTNRTNPRIYYFVRSVVSGLFTVLTRRQISGLGNIPEHGPYILICNHLAYLDPPLVMATLPTPVTVFAASTHRNDFFAGELMDQLGAIWVRRGEVDRQALRTAMAVLESGGVVGMAPEGTRSKTGALQAGKVGVAYLATRANVPLLPIVVTGTETALQTLKRFRRPVLTVTIGPLFRLPASGRVGTKELEVYTDQIMRRLAGMLPEKYRGVYK